MASETPELQAILRKVEALESEIRRLRELRKACLAQFSTEELQEELQGRGKQEEVKVTVAPRFADE
jgi:hypothetical protein